MARARQWDLIAALTAGWERRRCLIVRLAVVYSDKSPCLQSTCVNYAKDIIDENNEQETAGGPDHH